MGIAWSVDKVTSMVAIHHIASRQSEAHFVNGLVLYYVCPQTPVSGDD